MLCGAFIDPFCASQATKIKTTIQKVTNSHYKLILFLEEVSYAAHQGMIDLIKNTEKYICMKYSYFKKKSTYSVATPNFQHPQLQSSVSHYLSELILTCWFGAQVTFLIIFSVENSCAA